MLNLKFGKNFSSEECYTLIKVIRNSCKVESWLTNDENFNHNTGFKGMLSIVKNGILSIDEMYSRGIIAKREQAIDNVNGYEYISVSKVEDYDKRRDFYYDYRYPTNVNFVINKNIRNTRSVCRSCHNYSNEYLIYGSVLPEYIECIQVRLLELVNMVDKPNSGITMEKFIANYNFIIDCITYMIENNIDIPLVDASDDEMVVLDKKKLLSFGKMVK